MSIPPPTPKQARIIWAAITGLALGVLLALAVASIRILGILLSVFGPVIWPLAIAMVLAYLLDPVVNWLQHHGIPRARAILLVFAAVFLLFAGSFSLLIPPVIGQVENLLHHLPALVQQAQIRIQHWLRASPSTSPQPPVSSQTNAPPPSSSTQPKPPQASSSSPSHLPQKPSQKPPSPTAEKTGLPSSQGKPLLTWETLLHSETLRSILPWGFAQIRILGEWFLGRLGTLGSWFGTITGLGLVPIFLFYLLLEKDKIRAHWIEYIPFRNAQHRQEVRFVLESINGYLVAFFRGQVLVGFCDGILYMIGFFLVGVPYALLIGLAAIFLTIIPYIGAILICSSALLLSFIQYGDWLHPLLVLAVFAAVQTIEGYWIQPKILGEQVGLHPLTIILAVLAGMCVFGGVLGGILGVPIVAASRVILARYVFRRVPSSNSRGRRHRPRRRRPSSMGRSSASTPKNTTPGE